MPTSPRMPRQRRGIKPPSVREVSWPSAMTEGEKREKRAGQSPAPTLLLPRAYALSVRGDAPQGYLFRFAPLRGHRPLQNHRRRVCIYSGRAESSAPTHHPSLPGKYAPPTGAFAVTVCRKTFSIRIAVHLHRGSSRGQSPPRVGLNVAQSLALQGVRGAKRLFLRRKAAQK